MEAFGQLPLIEKVPGPYYSNYVFAAVEKWNDHEHKYLKDLYIKEIESVDERIGSIIKALKHKNLLKNTYIIFTSDHGEAFGEQGIWEHPMETHITVLTEVPWLEVLMTE